METVPFRMETRKACERNACGRYGVSWACPPAVGSLEEQTAYCKSFSSALFFSTCHGLEDSFDLEGMDRAREAHTRLTDEIAAYYRVERRRVLGAEACSECKKCTYPHAPCRRPDRMRRTVESYGIDVVSLCGRTGLKYCNGENTVTYFSLLLLE